MLDDGLPLAEILYYMQDAAVDVPVKTLADKAIDSTQDGLGFVAERWHEDGYFTHEECLVLVEVERHKSRIGLIAAIDLMILNSEQRISFWSGVLKGNNIFVGMILAMIGVTIYLSQFKRDFFLGPAISLGGTASDFQIIVLGDFLVGPFVFIVLAFIGLIIGYRFLRQRTTSIYDREPWRKVGFFKIYDRFFEYKVLSIISLLRLLEINTENTIDILRKVCISPYETYRLNEVAGEVSVDNKTLIDALENNITSPITHSLLRLASQREGTESITKAFVLTADELKEELAYLCLKYGVYLKVVAYLFLIVGMLNIVDLTTTIRELGEARENEALRR